MSTSFLTSIHLEGNAQHFWLKEVEVESFTRESAIGYPQIHEGMPTNHRVRALKY